MGKRKAKPTDEIVTLGLQGMATTGHPLWGAGGRPILIGDTCQHKDHGQCRITQVAGTVAHIKVLNHGSHRSVHVNELRRDVEALDKLIKAESF